MIVNIEGDFGIIIMRSVEFDFYQHQRKQDRMNTGSGYKSFLRPSSNDTKGMYRYFGKAMGGSVMPERRFSLGIWIGKLDEVLECLCFSLNLWIEERQNRRQLWRLTTVKKVDGGFLKTFIKRIINGASLQGAFVSSAACCQSKHSSRSSCHSKAFWDGVIFSSGFENNQSVIK